MVALKRAEDCAGPGFCPGKWNVLPGRFGGSVCTCPCHQGKRCVNAAEEAHTMTQPEPYPDFEGLRARHQQSILGGVCLCLEFWPCPTACLLDHIGTQAARIEALERLNRHQGEIIMGKTPREAAERVIADHEAAKADAKHWDKLDDELCSVCALAQTILRLTSPSQVEHRHLIAGETSTDCPACLASPSQEAQPCGINVWLTQQIRRFCVLPRGHEGMHSAEPVAKGEAE